MNRKSKKLQHGNSMNTPSLKDRVYISFPIDGYGDIAPNRIDA